MTARIEWLSASVGRWFTEAHARTMDEARAIVEGLERCQVFPGEYRIVGCDELYLASDRSLWLIKFDYPPIPDRSTDFSWAAIDYDGAPDSGDTRSGESASEDACRSAIEEWIWDNEEAV